MARAGAIPDRVAMAWSFSGKVRRSIFSVRSLKASKISLKEFLIEFSPYLQD